MIPTSILHSTLPKHRLERTHTHTHTHSLSLSLREDIWTMSSLISTGFCICYVWCLLYIRLIFTFSDIKDSLIGDFFFFSLLLSWEGFNPIRNSMSHSDVISSQFLLYFHCHQLSLSPPALPGKHAPKSLSQPPQPHLQFSEQLPSHVSVNCMIKDHEKKEIFYIFKAPQLSIFITKNICASPSAVDVFLTGYM